MWRHKVRRTLAVAVAFCLAVGATALPSIAHAVDVYVTPGTHHVNGRTWRTACSSYSTTVTRCRTDIVATTVVAVGGGFRATTGWTFNNLTYRESPRGPWKGNPLATPGEHTVNGRLWKTECDTPTTGRNGCRSWIRARVVEVVSWNPTQYGWRTKWQFNNMVRFSVPGTGNGTPTGNRCSGVPLPAGYSINAAGMPHPAGAPTQYHPNHIGNFIRQVLKDDRTTESQKRCLATQAGDHLIAGSHTREVNGVTSRWYPYGFAFTANPSVPSLQAPWYSGLAQGNVLSLSLMMENLTGDPVWRRYGRETFESFLVPRSNGGFMTRENGFLWFEEYPTQPPTSVLNGHFEALIGLAIWARDAQEPRATALVQEATGDLRPLLEVAEVDTPAGQLSTYDLVRGRSAAPLRLVPDSTFHVSGATLNGAALQIPVTSRSGNPTNVLRNSNMSVVSGGLPAQWQLVGSPAQVSASGGAVKIVTDGRAFQGVSQRVAAGTFAAGEPLTLTVSSRLTVPAGKPGASGKVIVYQRCASGTSVLFTTTQTRSRDWAAQDLTFPAPRSGCTMDVRLTSGAEGPPGTIVEFDDVTLGRADAVGANVVPRYDFSVSRTPTNTLALRGSGRATLQAHEGGRWRDVGSVSLTAGSVDTVLIPERLTGRNLHWGYHESHVVELMALHRLTGDSLYLEFARRWAPLAPSVNGSVPLNDRQTGLLDAEESVRVLPSMEEDH